MPASTVWYASRPRPTPSAPRPRTRNCVSPAATVQPVKGLMKATLTSSPEMIDSPAGDDPRWL